MIFRLHEREEEDVADRICARKEHDEAVDADAHSRRWRHTLADRFDEFFIQGARFEIPPGPLVRLIFEEFPLQLWIVQLAVGIAHLPAEDETLKTLH